MGFNCVEEHLINNDWGSTNVEEHLNKNYDRASTNVEEHLNKNCDRASTNVEERINKLDIFLDNMKKESQEKL